MKFVKKLYTAQTTWENVKQVADWLNAAGANYAIHGGWAMRMWGADRPAKDLDLIIPYLKDEYEKVRIALANLPDAKTSTVIADDMMTPATGEVVYRVQDGIVIDIMNNVSGLNFEDMEIVLINVDGVTGGTIPFASGSTMYRIKQLAGHDLQHHREDCQFLKLTGYSEVYSGMVNDPLSPPTNKAAIIVSASDPPVDLASL